MRACWLAAACLRAKGAVATPLHVSASQPCTLTCRVGGLDAELDWAHMLSLGEQQRVSVARLLHHRPAVAFLDEATSGGWVAAWLGACLAR